MCTSLIVTILALSFKAVPKSVIQSPGSSVSHAIPYEYGYIVAVTLWPWFFFAFFSLFMLAERVKKERVTKVAVTHVAVKNVPTDIFKIQTTTSSMHSSFTIYMI